MKKLTLLGVMAGLCLCLTAQTTKYLTVGDTLPDRLFTSLVNHFEPRAKLSDFKGKVVILDFWSRYCSNCILQFPKLDTLHKTFSKDLDVLLVNVDEFRNTKPEITDAIASIQKKLNTDLDLPVVLFDSTFTRQFFKEITLPHYIWLNEHRQIIAITSKQEITQNNIRDVIAGKTLCLPVKPNHIP